MKQDIKKQNNVNKNQGEDNEFGELTHISIVALLEK
jgi:hypothetical protein